MLYFSYKNIENLLYFMWDNIILLGIEDNITLHTLNQSFDAEYRITKLKGTLEFF